MKKFILLCFIIILICAAAATPASDKVEPIIMENTIPIIITEALITTEPAPAHILIITRHKNLEDQKLLWDLLNKYTKNEYITAGILGYFWRESSGRSNSCAGWYINDVTYQTDTCAEFTTKIDKGLKNSSTFEEFIEWSRYHYGGYGLGQWCTIRGLTELYNFAKEWDTSISDAEMQCAFTVYDIQNTYPDLWTALLSIENATEAGYKVGLFYDGSPQGAGYIGQLAQQFYDIYAKNAE